MIVSINRLILPLESTVDFGELQMGPGEARRVRIGLGGYPVKLLEHLPCPSRSSGLSKRQTESPQHGGWSATQFHGPAVGCSCFIKRPLPAVVHSGRRMAPVVIRGEFE